MISSPREANCCVVIVFSARVIPVSRLQLVICLLYGRWPFSEVYCDYFCK